MDNNELLMIVLAFILGCMASGMMRQMCGGRLVEGAKPGGGDDDDDGAKPGGGDDDDYGAKPSGDHDDVGAILAAFLVPIICLALLIFCAGELGDRGLIGGLILIGLSALIASAFGYILGLIIFSLGIAGFVLYIYKRRGSQVPQELQALRDLRDPTQTERARQLAI